MKNDKNKEEVSRWIKPLAIVTLAACAHGAPASNAGWQSGNRTDRQPLAVRWGKAVDSQSALSNSVIYGLCTDTIRKKVLAMPGMGKGGKGGKRSGKIDEMPSFPGGQKAMEEFLNANIRYPKVAFENNIQGKVTVQFMVEKDGSLTDIEVIKSVDDELDKEARRVISSMPRWTPGYNKGKPVRTEYYVPIIFRISHAGKDKRSSEAADTAGNKEGLVFPRYIVCGRYFAPTSTTHIPMTGMTFMTAKDKEGHRAIVLVPSDGKIPESLLAYEIPHEKVMNVRDFDEAAMTATSMYKATHASKGAKSVLTVGERLPGEFRVEDIDGGVWTGESLSGHVTVINCWYSGCGPCRKEMAELSRWKEEWPSVIFLSANFENADKVREIVTAEGFNWTHIYNDKYFTQWVGDAGYPLTIVLDKNGIVRNITHGTNNEKRTAIHKMIEQLTGR